MTTSTKLAFVGIVLSSVLFSACFHCVRGSGNIIEEKRAVSAFRSIDLDVPATLYVTQREPGPVIIKTDDNIMDIVSTEVRGETLEIKPTEKRCCMDPTELTITASAQTIETLRISGSGDIIIQGDFNGERLALEIDGSGAITNDRPISVKSGNLSVDGSGDIALDLKVADLSTSIDGSGDIRLSGTAGTHKIDIDGSGAIQAEGFGTRNTRVQIDGSGECHINVTEHLDVIIDGSGDVYFKGNPRIIQDIDGSGSIQSI